MYVEILALFGRILCDFYCPLYVNAQTREDLSFEYTSCKRLPQFSTLVLCYFIFIFLSLFFMLNLDFSSCQWYIVSFIGHMCLLCLNDFCFFLYHVCILTNVGKIARFTVWIGSCNESNRKKEIVRFWVDSQMIWVNPMNR